MKQDMWIRLSLDHHCTHYLDHYICLDHVSSQNKFRSCLRSARLTSFYHCFDLRVWLNAVNLIINLPLIWISRQLLRRQRTSTWKNAKQKKGCHWLFKWHFNFILWRCHIVAIFYVNRRTPTDQRTATCAIPAIVTASVLNWRLAMKWPVSVSVRGMWLVDSATPAQTPMLRSPSEVVKVWKSSLSSTWSLLKD